MRRFVIMMGVAAALFSSSAHAGPDELIEGAKLCTAYLPRYERENGIPTHLLSAIATTESGRYHEGLKIRVPWPWTINAAGKGYVFDTKAQAIAMVRRLRAHGVQSIDVGCMQVNLYHHPDAFTSLDQAFDPQANIAYAAGFLRSLYDEEGSWKKAAAGYHSRTPGLGRKYVNEVYNSWYQIIDKLRAAKLEVPESAVTAMNELKSSVHKAVVKVHHTSEQSSAQAAIYHPQQNTHNSQQEAANRSDVIVVKPEIKVANNAQVAATTPAQSTPQIVVAPAQQVPLTYNELAPAAGGPDNSAMHALDESVVQTSAMTSHKDGPHFIFND